MTRHLAALGNMKYIAHKATIIDEQLAIDDNLFFAHVQIKLL
jgi:hypothetical protein